MMITKDIQRNYVKILLNEQVQSKQLGKYAFAPERDMFDSENLPLPIEPNTAYEQELYRAITDQIRDDNIHLDPKHTATIKKFLRAGQHDNVFKSPRGMKIYRGESVTPEKLKRILGLGENDKIPAKSGTERVNYTWTNRESRGGKNAGSSWTTNFKIAWDRFARSATTRIRPIKIIYTAKENQLENFLNLSPEAGVPLSGLYRMIPGSYSDESEVIALGPIEIEEITWEYDDFYANPEFDKHFVLEIIKL